MQRHLAVWCCIAQIAVLINPLHSEADKSDVSALNVMFTSLNSPSKLSGWKSNGGDPCSESWKGITCSGSSITKIDLSDLGLSGSMGYQLSSLSSVTYFDMSKNNLEGEIPYQLPPNANHIDLSQNGFTGNVPYSISEMKDLSYLNLAHNQLNNQLSDVFGKLSKLKELDLSYNSMSGKLPQSLESLSSLTKLCLQNNQLSGNINVLANLPLDELNVENNKFSGWIPLELKGMDKLKTGGNSWSSGPAPPPPPGTPAVKIRPKKKAKNSNSDQSSVTGVVIAGIAIGVLITMLIIVAAVSRRRSYASSSHFLDEEKSSEKRSPTSFSSNKPPNDFPLGKEYSGFKPFDSFTAFDIKPLQKSASTGVSSTVSDAQSFHGDQLETRLDSRKSNFAPATAFSWTELQTTTGNFASGRLLGEGSIGCVYRAKYADGKILAVKKIEPTLLHGENEFSEIISNISKFHHPNIAELIGHCSENEQYILVNEYFRNGSLNHFLHVSDDFSKPLTWNTRMRIALGTARAVEYLHEICCPSIVHKNIKSSNILLDAELNPRLSDYGLASFHQRTSQNLGAGYNAPECVKPSAYTTKSDVYSFGIVMLELLTGRKPFDSGKPKSQQSLVRWAIPQLHDIDALGKMVDPALRGLYPPKSVSRFADIIALCVQPEPEFRPPMSEVVQALVRLLQRSSMRMGDELSSTSRRTDDDDY